MTSPAKRTLLLSMLAVALLAMIAAFVGKNGASSLELAPSWFAAGIRIKFSLDQDPSAGGFYEKTGGVPLSLAAVVRELHKAWPGESVLVINTEALAVGTGLLHRPDIEVGEMVEGTFVPMKSPAWQINQRMSSEVKGSAVLFENERKYIFRRK